MSNKTKFVAALLGASFLAIVALMSISLYPSEAERRITETSDPIVIYWFLAALAITSIFWKSRSRVKANRRATNRSAPTAPATPTTPTPPSKAKELFKRLSREALVLILIGGMVTAMLYALAHMGSPIPNPFTLIDEAHREASNPPSDSQVIEGVRYFNVRSSTIPTDVFLSWPLARNNRTHYWFNLDKRDAHEVEMHRETYGGVTHTNYLTDNGDNLPAVGPVRAYRFKSLSETNTTVTIATTTP